MKTLSLVNLFKDRFYIYTLIAALLCIPAFFINLGIHAYIGDEAIRSLVAFEMMKMGNYLVPTMNGEFYFCKPPLYNWILILFYKATGLFNEWITRLPTVLFSFLFTWLIWFFNQHKLQNKKFAIILAFMFLTCGRMIFYDSFLGLIDIFFSMVTYSMIMLAYSLANRSMYKWLYPMLYFLSSVGFMLKGLPSFHFLFFALLIVHFMFGNWHFLWSRYHLLSIILSVSIIGLYFYGYDKYMEAGNTVAPLVDQATRRTVLKYGLYDMAKHVVSYPFENIFHFLPWSLMGLLVLKKNIFTLLKKDQYIWYVCLSFISNFSLYWISPEVYPRYILMLIPLIFTVWIYLYEFEIGVDNKLMKIISYLFKFITIVSPILIISRIGSHWLKYVENGQYKVLLLSILLGLLSFLYFNDKKNRTILFVIYILVLRIGFNLIILPIRNNTSDKEYLKDESIRIAKKYKDIKIYDKSILHWQSTIYFSQVNNEMLTRSNDLTLAKYFIIDSTYMNNFIKVDSFTDALHCGTRWVINGNKY
jgi:4-amino-4-deoxy-L-arabinose transferase-like glycosyltransferase